MKVLPVVYCIEVKEGLVGQLYKNQLHKSIKQLQLMADKAQKKLDIYVMSLSKADCPADCKWIDATEVNELCKRKFKLQAVKSYSTFWRLFVPWLLPFSIMDKVLYLDSDTWCINPQFFKFFDIKFNDGNDCIGVRDILLRHTQAVRLLGKFQQLMQTARKQQLEDSFYINAGVLMISIDNMLKHFPNIKMLLNSIQSIYNISQIAYADQDIINILYNIQLAPYKFNTLVNAKSSNYDFDKWLLHFTGNVIRHEQYKNEFPDFRINRFKKYL